jgi:hypothetical protein
MHTLITGFVGMLAAQTDILRTLPRQGTLPLLLLLLLIQIQMLL